MIIEIDSSIWREEIQNRNGPPRFGGKEFKIEMDPLDLAGRNKWTPSIWREGVPSITTQPHNHDCTSVVIFIPSIHNNYLFNQI